MRPLLQQLAPSKESLTMENVFALYMGNRVSKFTRSDSIRLEPVGSAPKGGGSQWPTFVFWPIGFDSIGGGPIGPILGKSGGRIPIVPIPIAHV